MDLQEQCTLAIRDGIARAIQDKFTSSYGSPLNTLLESICKAEEPALRSLMGQAFKEALDCNEFRVNVKSAVKQQLAKTLVQRFGGEIEKQVNALKSDPTTRARITMAIEEITSSH